MRRLTPGVVAASVALGLAALVGAAPTVVRAAAPLQSAKGGSSSAPSSRRLAPGVTPSASARAALVKDGGAGVLESLLPRPKSRLQQASEAITELDVAAASRLLDGLGSQDPMVRFERGRLALYKGDCDTAAAVFSSPSFAERPVGRALGSVASRCQGVIAGSEWVKDDQHGVWVRFQDADDEVLMSAIVDVVVRSRKALQRDLGVDLPRPFRLDLVRDLFSLSAMTGLPLKAAETTGTVGIARFGRVSMISPRAVPRGYPWEDTLVHELAHLVVSRATRDRAPLWLQEGLAKREELRWRDPRPFDREVDEAPRTALQAQLNGESVGLDKLGKSIAMLPSARAASIAFAEVASFIQYWVDLNGEPALYLLLRDLRGLGDETPDAAMRSVTGYSLEEWRLRWRHWLGQQEARLLAPPSGQDTPTVPSPDGAAQVSDGKPLPPRRAIRLSDLTFDAGRPGLAARYAERGLASAGTLPELRFRAARGRLATDDRSGARAILGTVGTVGHLHGGWFALAAAFESDASRATRLLRTGSAVTPYQLEVACGPMESWTAQRPLPDDPKRRAVCRRALAIPREP